MKKIILLLFIFKLSLGLTQEEIGWHFKSPEDGVLGCGITQGLELLQGKESDTIIVAVIDNGAQTLHEDLKGQIWINPDEIAGNNIDDDGNGYVDDIHGWNFLGNEQGESLKNARIELARIAQGFANGEQVADYNQEEIVAALTLKQTEAKEEIEEYKLILKNYNVVSHILKNALKKKALTPDNVRRLKEQNDDIKNAKEYYLRLDAYQITPELLQKRINTVQKNLKTRLNQEFDNREEVIGDHPNDMNDSIYGNNQVWARGPYHGTSVASMIGALNNGKGVRGVTPKVKLMILRVVPNGDEADKDIALAIRYAVNKGAKIINCSFGKLYSYNPKFVEEAIQYAADKDVLVVVGAGNHGLNVDEHDCFPKGRIAGERAPNFITVGASDSIDDKNLVAVFSNYGKEQVDVLAPGVNLPSAALDNAYDYGSGTSIAAPVVSGVAALLWSYFPELTAAELKNVLLQSVYQPNTQMVIAPGSKEEEIELSATCREAGIVNFYNAVLLIQSTVK